ncbi:GD13088 [Drosophila simulans]|uniref:GD13088 n=1 Tax=Drosophila simulans TaxID=7240 RepID=B4QKA0_DROSI|nr:GD13088 [Drosophila simulans]
MRTQTNCHVTTTLLLLHNCISSNNPDQRLNEDICTLSTLCSSYKKLSPTTEFPPMRLLSPNQDSDPGRCPRYSKSAQNVAGGWAAEGPTGCVDTSKIANGTQVQSPHQDNNNVERLRIYANQLEHVSRVLDDALPTELHAPLQQLRQDIEVVRTNANWTQLLESNETDHNANGDVATP